MSSLRQLPSYVWIVLAVLLLFPFAATEFFVLQIGAYSMILGILALSLMWLAGYGGMVSLAQVAIAGLGAYMLPILGTNTQDVMGLGWPWWLTVPAALLVSVIFAAFIGAVAARTEGIYTLMITLAFSVVVFYFARQNYTLFNGFTGYAGIEPPTLFGVYWRDPVPFYYLVLALAVALYAFVTYAARSTFGLSLQAVRDNPRRLGALGFDVTAHRIFAFAVSGLIAGIGGVLLVWFNGRIAPSSISIDITIDILVIAVVGGLRLPIGPFIGALAFVLLDNFAIDLINRERFNTVIGIVFLLIVYFSPDGLLGLWEKYRPRRRTPSRAPVQATPEVEPAE
ncbi:MAG: branched-chain amino acid ABC transporter permease [Pseudomonadota bacterium]